MFVSAEDLIAFTGLKRSSAQARFLAKHHIKFMLRLDGSIALRQEELDRHTLSEPTGASKVAPEWHHEPNLVFEPPRPCSANVEGRKCKLNALDGSDYCWTHKRYGARRTNVKP